MSINDDRAILLEKVTKILLGTYDFQTLAKQSVDLIVKQLRAQGLAAAAVFRVHANENVLQAYAYSSKYNKIVDKILPKKFSELTVPLSATDNLSVKTVVTGQIQQSQHTADFSKHGIPDYLSHKIQKLMRGKLNICFPIRTRSGRIAGAILFLISEEKLSGEQVVLLETFADQLGLAFSNVSAFERLMHQYKQKSDDLHDHDNEPTIKFTLRITPRQDKQLDLMARERGKTKAELIRELLDRLSS